MRPMKTGVEVGGGGNVTEKKSLAPAVEELWDTWEIHFLILLSLFLQVFLFLFAGMRRRSASSVLRTVLWLAYLSADTVAIFVLGHLAVHASEPGHQLMSFWAPFVLVHLGGQDTITAFSKEDNELWKRHLLNLVTQVAISTYVVAKASWPDHRLKAAMVLMFLSGSIKYAERTSCLFSGSSAILRWSSLRNLSNTLRALLQAQGKEDLSYGVLVATRDQAIQHMRLALHKISKGSRGWHSKKEQQDARSLVGNIMSLDAPLNAMQATLAAEDLPGLLQGFISSADRCGAYDYVGTRLVYCYHLLYTKIPFRESFYSGFVEMILDVGNCRHSSIFAYLIMIFMSTLFLLYALFHIFSATIALVLFMASQKGGQLQTGRADIIVSYILLGGAIILDVSSAIMSIFSIVLSFNVSPGISRIVNYIQPAWNRKQWSEELAQYSMIKRYALQDTTADMLSIRHRIGRCLGPCGGGLLELTRIPITRDHTPLMEFVLDNLLLFGTRKEWNIASSRGKVALDKWMDDHHVPESSRPERALVKATSGIDFPTSVLIWHIATDMCYYYCGLDGASTSTDPNQTEKNKQISIELSNYIMYLTFKCGVMLTPNSQLTHDKAHDEIRKVLAGQHNNLGEKDVVGKLFGEKREEKKEAEPGHDDDGADNHHLQELLRSMEEALYSPVLPRACAVAQELISTNDETDRWGLIAAVWSEMLYYTAPRCGGAFHYEHLSTGGEFITHVLLLMRSLGPFMPTTGAPAPQALSLPI